MSPKFSREPRQAAKLEVLREYHQYLEDKADDSNVRGFGLDSNVFSRAHPDTAFPISEVKSSEEDSLTAVESHEDPSLVDAEGPIAIGVHYSILHKRHAGQEQVHTLDPALREQLELYEKIDCQVACRLLQTLDGVFLTLTTEYLPFHYFEQLGENYPEQADEFHQELLEKVEEIEQLAIEFRGYRTPLKEALLDGQITNVSHLMQKQLLPLISNLRKHVEQVDTLHREVLHFIRDSEVKAIRAEYLHDDDTEVGEEETSGDEAIQASTLPESWDADELDSREAYQSNLRSFLIANDQQFQQLDAYRDLFRSMLAALVFSPKEEPQYINLNENLLALGLVTNAKPKFCLSNPHCRIGVAELDQSLLHVCEAFYDVIGAVHHEVVSAELAAPANIFKIAAPISFPDVSRWENLQSKLFREGSISVRLRGEGEFVIYHQFPKEDFAVWEAKKAELSESLKQARLLAQAQGIQLTGPYVSKKKHTLAVTLKLPEETLDGTPEADSTVSEYKRRYLLSKSEDVPLREQKWLTIPWDLAEEDEGGVEENSGVERHFVQVDGESMLTLDGRNQVPKILEAAEPLMTALEWSGTVVLSALQKARTLRGDFDDEDEDPMLGEGAEQELETNIVYVCDAGDDDFRVFSENYYITFAQEEPRDWESPLIEPTQDLDPLPCPDYIEMLRSFGTYLEPDNSAPPFHWAILAPQIEPLEKLEPNLTMEAYDLTRKQLLDDIKSLAAVASFAFDLTDRTLEGAFQATESLREIKSDIISIAADVAGFLKEQDPALSLFVYPEWISFSGLGGTRLFESAYILNFVDDHGRLQAFGPVSDEFDTGHQIVPVDSEARDEFLQGLAVSIEKLKGLENIQHSDIEKSLKEHGIAVEYTPLWTAILAAAEAKIIDIHDAARDPAESVLNLARLPYFIFQRQDGRVALREARASDVIDLE